MKPFLLDSLSRHISSLCVKRYNLGVPKLGGKGHAPKVGGVIDSVKTFPFQLVHHENLVAVCLQRITSGLSIY